MAQRNVLTLEPQGPEFVASVFAGYSKTRKRAECRRLDIVIDGRPLRYLWRDWEQPEWDIEVPVPDLITMMSPSSRKAASTQLDQLRGPDAGDAPKRVELFFCPACFDISDGILSVEVARTADAVTWRAFGWKDEEQDGDADALITNATELVFDAVAYDAVLGSAQAAFRLGFGWRRKR